MFANILRKDASEDFDLLEDEQRLHITGRHWIVLIGRLITPLFVALFFGGLVLYRSSGGSFLVLETGLEPGFDFVNWVLIALLLLAIMVWVGMRSRKSSRSRIANAAIFAVLGLAALLYFRYLGGRIFYRDFIPNGIQTFDASNLVLIIIAIIALVFCFFAVYDWINDQLILTNRRVVYDNDQVFIPRLIERRVQEQLNIEDIQNVVASTDTYPQHWLKYGKIIIQSARTGGQIVFPAANEPTLMQSKIMAEVKKLRKERDENSFAEMIEASVYGNTPQKPLRQVEVKTSGGWRLLSWLIPENPEISEDKGGFTIVWRPHWIFHARGLFLPVLFALVSSIIIVVLTRFELLSPGVLALTVFVVAAVFLAWAAWESEDYRNDMYILTPTNVIDIEKKPFGPEDRRTASLGALQNVSLETTFLSNLLGYGDVILQTAGGGGSFTFNGVPNPRDVISQVNDYRNSFNRGEKERAMNDTLSLLRHYHSAQERHNELNPQPSSTESQL